MPPRPSVAERPQPSAADMLARAGHGMEGAADPAAQHVLQQRRLPAVMHRGHVEALEVGEGLGQRMAGGARRIGPEGELLALRPGDEILQRLRRAVLADAQRQRRGAELAEEGEVVELVGPAPQHDRRLHEIRDVEQDGVAVRRGVLHRLGADQPAGAGAVLDHHGLAEDAGHRLGDQPGPDVGGAAGRQRHDHADGAVGKGRLGEGRRGERPAASVVNARRRMGVPPAVHLPAG